MILKIAIWFAFCYTAFALQVSDKEAIERIIQAQASAWNGNGCKGFADSYSDHADFINIFGAKFSGKEEIEARHVQILQAFLRDSQFQVLDIALREIRPECVVANVYWQVTGFRTPRMDINQPGETRNGVFTHVFMKNQNRWEIEASQNTLMP